MGFLMRILTLILSNGIAITAASQIIPGITFDVTWENVLAAGALLGFFNAALKPLLKLLSLPFIVLTLGLFTVIINITLLFLVDYLLPSFQIQGLIAAFWGTIVISIVNYIINNLFND